MTVDVVFVGSLGPKTEKSAQLLTEAEVVDNVFIVHPIEDRLFNSEEASDVQELKAHSSECLLFEKNPHKGNYLNSYVKLLKRALESVKSEVVLAIGSGSSIDTSAVSKLIRHHSEFSSIEKGFISGGKPKGKIGVMGYSLNDIPFAVNPNLIVGFTKDLKSLTRVLLDVPTVPSLRPSTYIGGKWCAQFDVTVAKMFLQSDRYLNDTSLEVHKSFEISQRLIPSLFYPLPRVDFRLSESNALYPYTHASRLYGEIHG